MLKNLLKAALSIAVLVMMSAAAGVWYFKQWLDAPMDLNAGMVLTVERGSSLSHSAQDLARLGVLRHPRLLSIYARITGKTGVQAGEYALDAGLTPASLLDKLNRGEVIYYSLTFVEGTRFFDIRQQLENNPRINATLAGQSDAQVLKQIDPQLTHIEGWLFPDTYRFPKGTTDLEILRQAYGRMQEVLDEEWQQRALDLPYKAPYEALIMASIVEKETGAKEERPAIAGVFVRRLEKKMLLQTDPTIIYSLGPEFDGNLKRIHLQTPSPYNSYRNRGLPPTPIAMPGRAAIHAALHPAPGEDLYFVARGDGSHQFSATLEDHNKAVQKYQVRKRRRDYQSRPQAAGEEEPQSTAPTADESQPASSDE